jgi:hypothetical protein
MSCGRSAAGIMTWYGVNMSAYIWLISGVMHVDWLFTCCMSECGVTSVSSQLLLTVAAGMSTQRMPSRDWSGPTDVCR